MLTKEQLLLPLSRNRGDAIVVTTMGVVRPWGKISHSDLDFASADSAMGHAADLALGIALAQPQRKVICLNGDGSMLMSLGTLVTIVGSGVSNLILFVIQNGTYEITGNQSIPAGEHIDFLMMARAAGFQRLYRFNEPTEFTGQLPEILSGKGPVFVLVHIKPGTEGPIRRHEEEESQYLKVSLAESCHRMRKVLSGSDVASDLLTKI
ncbi:MAG: thiamine pyrophosphate-dependent enzyme [Acidobacteriia bacterium]|nr:thiamine pyrophosphate-dependent enzyme [Terriglobia bacterium]